jgi:hypothetical protein
MKKLTLYILTALLLLSIFPMPLKAVTETGTIPMTATKPDESAEVNVLLARLNEINAIDKSKLKAPEKKELRKEVRAIKSELNEMSSKGVYLSVGAIIIIVLLLILLL